MEKGSRKKRQGEQKGLRRKGFFREKPGRRWVLAGVLVVVIAAGAGIAAYVITSRQTQQAAAEQQGRQNRQSVRSETVTEEGSVSVGTVSQTFELDLSEYTGENTQFSWENAGGGLSLNFGQGMGGSAQGSASSGTRQLTVEEVYVSVGEEVKAGDPILKVTADTLEEIRQGFTEDVSDAEETYEKMQTQLAQTQLEASTEQKENELYGAYADTEYELAVRELQETADSLTESIAEAQEALEKEQEELAELQAALAEQQEELETAAFTVESEDRNTNAYGWLVAVNAKVDLETLINNTESEIETLEESIDSRNENIASLNMQLVTAQKALATGTIEAESTRQTRTVKYESAQEIYDVTTELAQFDADNAKEDYDEAVSRLEELDTYIADQMICAASDGVITAVSISVGDTLQEGTELISLNSYDEVTITLTLDEDDMDAASLGSTAQITFAAFPDEIFEGEVTEIGDAQIDSNTNTTTYEVVVSILENASKLYEGMSAEVTFTRQQGGTEK